MGSNERFLKGRRMNERDPSKTDVGRRKVIEGTAAVGLMAATGISPLVYAGASSDARPDLITSENARPGTRDWLLTKTVPGKINRSLFNGRCREIEGHCSANSVRVGETLKIMVSANPAKKGESTPAG